MFKNQKGVSLVQVILSAGMLGGIALGMARMMQITQDSETKSTSKIQTLQISQLVTQILSEHRHCNSSIGNPSFKKSEVDFDGVTIDKAVNFEPTEGIDLELWYGNSDGSARTVKKLNGANNVADPDRSYHGNVKIDYIKLLFNNGLGPCDDNYCEGTVDDVAQVVVGFTSKITNKKTRVSKEIFDLSVWVTTDDEGNSTLDQCLSIMGGGATGSVEQAAEAGCEAAGMFYDASRTPPCQHSLGNTNHFINLNALGPSLTEYEFKCPEGMGMQALWYELKPVGMGDHTDIKFNCSYIDKDTLFPVGPPNWTRTRIYDPFMHPLQALSCPAEKFIVGFTVNIHGVGVNQSSRVGVKCAHYDGSNPEYVIQGGHAHGPGFLGNDCANNTVLREARLYVGTGKFISRMAGTCW